MRAASTIERHGFAEAKSQLSALTAGANETGIPFIITKNNKPWVEVRPLAVRKKANKAVTITPTRRNVTVIDLDDVFEGYDGNYVPNEDGFANAVGHEEM